MSTSVSVPRSLLRWLVCLLSSSLDFSPETSSNCDEQARLAASLNISRDLHQKTRLPDLHSQSVARADVVLRGELLLCTKSRGLLWDSVSSLKRRVCVLTRQHCLLLYFSQNRGFVLNLRQCEELRTISDRLCTSRFQAVSLRGKEKMDRGAAR